MVGDAAGARVEVPDRGPGQVSGDPERRLVVLVPRVPASDRAQERPGGRRPPRNMVWNGVARGSSLGSARMEVPIFSKLSFHLERKGGRR